MNRFTVGDLIRHRGWIKSIRKQRKWTFFNMNNGHDDESLQVVIPTSEIPKKKEGGRGGGVLGYHGGVVVSGKVVESNHPGQKIELQDAKIESYYPIPDPDNYPFGPRKEYSPNFIRNFPHLRSKLRSSNQILRLRNNLTFGIHGFFQKEDFLQVQTPILTSNVCESGGQVFQVRPQDPQIIAQMRKNENQRDSQVYFDKDVFLTVSGQLHLEAIANGHERVYNFSPVFRAEMGRTRRHLAEFTMIEAEIAFLDQLEDLLNFIEKFVKASLKSGIENKNLIPEDRLDLISNCITRDFKRISYSDLMDILIQHSSQFKITPKRGMGLGTEHELFACEYFDNLPVFVTNLPNGPFYTRGDNTVDLLFPGIGELVGGSLRERDPDVLRSQIVKAGLTIENFEWYVQMRRNGGAVPTGGFGLGFERLIKFLSGLENIQDTLPFPRTPHNCQF